MKQKKLYVVTIIILFLALLSLIGYIVYDKYFEKKNNKISKINDNQDIIVNKYESNNYQVPFINIKSDDVEDINNEIEKYYKNTIDNDESISLTIKYDKYVNDNILSLVIKQTIEGYSNFKVYNVDVYTGKKLTNREIISQKNIDEDILIKKVEVAYKNKFNDYYGTKEKWLKDQDGDKEEAMNYYDEQLNKTISSNNCNLNKPMFLKDNGKVSMIANIYMLAGAESKEFIVDIDI